MKKAARIGFPAIGLLALFFLPHDLSAQMPVPGTSMVSMRIKNLTPETRDAITRELAMAGEARILFACVPAGIMIFGSLEPVPIKVLEDQLSPLLLRHGKAKDLTELTMDIRQAEEQCALARNR